MALKRGIVKLENYQNNWVKEYEEEAKTIQSFWEVEFWKFIILVVHQYQD